MKQRALYLCAVVLSSLLNGCTLEAPPEDEVLTIPQEYLNTSDDERINEFTLLSKKCVLGDYDSAILLFKTYFSSLKKLDLKQPELQDYLQQEGVPQYFYQTQRLTFEYERCLQKTRFDKPDTDIVFFITDPKTIARIAHHFYLNDSPREGAFWCRRLINLAGASRAYYILGSQFMTDKKTYAISADMLKEAALSGNTGAQAKLMEQADPQTIFDKIRSSQKKL